MKDKNFALVSVIVPIYNVEGYLDKCVESLLSQTYKHLEIILVDDGSTDKSGEMVDSYVSKYKNVRALHKKNGGLSSARNAGIDVARGEWLVFVDSDDYVSSDYVSKLFDLAINNNADISTCSFEAFSDDNLKLKASPIWPDETLSGINAMDDMLQKMRPAYVCLCMFRASLFKDNRVKFPEGREFEDVATKIKLLRYAKKVSFSNEKLYRYLIRKESITGSKISQSRIEDFLKAIRDVEDYIMEFNESKDRTKYINYFKYSSLMVLIGYLAREKELGLNEKKYWRKIHKMACDAYWKGKFPTIKLKLFKGLLLVLATDRNIYSAIYRKVKK